EHVLEDCRPIREHPCDPSRIGLVAGDVLAGEVEDPRRCRLVLRGDNEDLAEGRDLRGVYLPVHLRHLGAEPDHGHGEGNRPFGRSPLQQGNQRLAPGDERRHSLHDPPPDRHDSSLAALQQRRYCRCHRQSRCALFFHGLNRAGTRPIPGRTWIHQGHVGRPRSGPTPYRFPQTPRAIAAAPVRATSTRPSGRIRSQKASTFSLVPVISKTKLSSVVSTTFARKMSAVRSASTRFSPVPATFISASSRSTDGPSTVRSCTSCTGTIRLSWALICSITAGVPVVTMVMRERCPR